VIRTMIGRELVGSGAESCQTVTIRDATANDRFHQLVDLATVFVTHSFPHAPTCNNRSKMNCVTEMVKEKDGCIEEADKKFRQKQSSFVDNSRLYPSIAESHASSFKC
jgi:hypothetical protein